MSLEQLEKYFSGFTCTDKYPEKHASCACDKMTQFNNSWDYWNCAR